MICRREGRPRAGRRFSAVRRAKIWLSGRNVNSLDWNGVFDLRDFFKKIFYVFRFEVLTRIVQNGELGDHVACVQKYLEYCNNKL